MTAAKMSIGAGLATGGRHWSPADHCYVFADPPTGRNTMRMYLSKNTPSFLAKATVGVCTSRDTDLWARRDHVHLNVVDPSVGVVGNIQLHVLVRESRRVLLVRAVNASTSYLTAARARAFVEAALVACLEIAATSEIDEVHLCEGLSFWHLNSSRPEIRAVLEPLYLELVPTVLEPPFFLPLRGCQPRDDKDLPPMGARPRKGRPVPTPPIPGGRRLTGRSRSERRG